MHSNAGTASLSASSVRPNRTSVETSKASAIRTADRNKSERMNWIAANNELHAQNELLRNENERLVKENERLRSVMARVKVAEL